MGISGYWDKCPAYLAHLDGKRDVQSWNTFIKYAGNRIDYQDKTVIDYGIGAGYYGEQLIKDYDIKMYKGIDISSRSITAATLNLQRFGGWEIHRAPIDFSTLNGDIFISVACIQHFPDQYYLDEFIDNLNTSGVDDIILNIRYNKKTQFISHDYTKDHQVVHSCKTNKGYISTRLTKYGVTYDKFIPRNKYQQYLIYKKGTDKT